MSHLQGPSLSGANVMMAWATSARETRTTPMERTVCANTANTTNTITTASQETKYTKNWGRHDPIPFDSRITIPAYSDYLRGAGSRGQSTVDLPLEQLLSRNFLISDNAALSVSMTTSAPSDLLRFLPPAEQKDSADLVASSHLVQSLIGQNPIGYPVQTQPTKASRGSRGEELVLDKNIGKGPKAGKTSSQRQPAQEPPRHSGRSSFPDAFSPSASSSGDKHRGPGILTLKDVKGKGRKPALKPAQYYPPHEPQSQPWPLKSLGGPSSPESGSRNIHGGSRVSAPEKVKGEEPDTPRKQPAQYYPPLASQGQVRPLKSRGTSLPLTLSEGSNRPLAGQQKPEPP